MTELNPHIRILKGLSKAQRDAMTQTGRFTLSGVNTATIESLKNKGILTEGLRLSLLGRRVRKAAISSENGA